MSLRWVLALTLAVFSATHAAAAAFSQEELNRIVGAFYSSTAIDESAAYDVQDLTITKDIATFTLKKGTIHLTKPIEGVVRTAVFIGDGSVVVKPVRPMDRLTLDIAAKEHLNRAAGGPLVTSFDQMVIVSFDGTIEQLTRSRTPASGSSSTQSAASALSDRVKLMNDLELAMDLEVLAAKSGIPDGPTLVSFKSADYGWLEFDYQPRDLTEVGLFKVERLGSTLRPRPLVNAHKLADLDANGRYIADALKDQKLWLDTTHYKLDITIPDSSHYLVEGEVTFTPLKDDLKVIYFDIVNNVFALRSDDKSAKQLKLLSVTDASGELLPYVHRKHQAWIVPAEPLKAGNSYTYKFSIDTQTVTQVSSVHWFILNDAPWYPVHGYFGGIYTMDWTVKARKPLYATGSGKMVKETTEGAYNVTQLVFEQPVWLPFLIFGQYQKDTDVYKSAAGAPDVNLAVFYWPRADFNVEDDRGRLVTVPVTVPGGKPKGLLEEAKEIMKFYETLYGPFPFRNLHVAQMSPGMGFGQGPAGFIQLTGEAFMSSAELANFGSARSKADFFHAFFSHEMAHQYWAHAIKWATDEDVWLSESYAEYTSGLFIMGLQGQAAFQGQLKEWKDNAKLADPHAPIAWANNVSGDNAGQWRRGLLYNKGPYIVHMLRMQVGHENYVKAMKALMAKYSHQQITTDQLKQEFETVVGYKLDYFFDQWYRGTGIPTIDYSTSVRQTEDGKWLATVNINQRDKQNVKILSMPVFFHFGKGKTMVKERPVVKADDVYQVKLPEKPDSITLDDYHTLLADIFQQQGASGQ